MADDLPLWRAIRIIRISDIDHGGAFSISLNLVMPSAHSAISRSVESVGSTDLPAARMRGVVGGSAGFRR